MPPLLAPAPDPMPGRPGDPDGLRDAEVGLADGGTDDGGTAPSPATSFIKLRNKLSVFMRALTDSP